MARQQRQPHAAQPVDGQPACLTVAHLDSLVLARCGFNHSADYRSVMAFGHARLVEDAAEKERALSRWSIASFPAAPRPAPKLAQEIKATAVVGMEIERASAKIRAKGVADDEEDYALAGLCRAHPGPHVIGAPEPCPRLLDGVARPAALPGIAEGRPLEEALAEAHFPQDPRHE